MVERELSSSERLIVTSLRQIMTEQECFDLAQAFFRLSGGEQDVVAIYGPRVPPALATSLKRVINHILANREQFV